MKQKLQEWFMAHQPDEDLLYKDGLAKQVMFVRDEINTLFAADLPYPTRKDDTAFVISTHRSKSVLLPVYSLERPGLRLILRNNFFNWKMSVISEKPVEVDYETMFHTTPPVEPGYTGNPLAPVYFEGFPEDLIFGYYSESDKKRWSAEIHGHFTLWMVVFLMMRQFNVIKPLVWHTKESHRKELEEKRSKILRGDDATQ